VKTNHVIGIDPSLSATGVIVLDDAATLIAHKVVTSKPSGPLVGARMERIQAMCRTIKEMVEEYRPDVICLEGYSLGTNMPGVSSRVEFGGLLRYVLWSGGWRLVEVAPTTLKKFVTGKGAWKGGGKTPMIVALTSRYGVQFGTDDEYDAYGLARMALQVAGHETATNQFQSEAVKVAVDGPPAKKTRKKVVA